MKKQSTAQMKKYRLFWRIVALAGFILILVNGLAYLTGWKEMPLPSTAIGIIFVALAMIFGQRKK